MVTIALFVVFLLLASKGLTAGWITYLVLAGLVISIIMEIHMRQAKRNLNRQ